MFSIDDMKDCIQEWFSEALTPTEVAKTYHSQGGRGATGFYDAGTNKE